VEVFPPPWLVPKKGIKRWKKALNPKPGHPIPEGKIIPYSSLI